MRYVLTGIMMGAGIQMRMPAMVNKLLGKFGLTLIAKLSQKNIENSNGGRIF